MSLFKKLFGGSTPPGSEPIVSVEPVESEAPVLMGGRDNPLGLPVSPAREFATDTATLVIFDLSALKHRLEDDCDWWADPAEELKELRARNVLIFALGSDGYYDAEISDAIDLNCTRYSLSVPSGEVFIGAGEELTGEGIEPDCNRGGFFLNIQPGDYAVSASLVDDKITLQIVPSAPFDNSQTEPLTLS